MSDTHDDAGLIGARLLSSERLKSVSTVRIGTTPMAEEQAIPQDALDAAEAADTKCQRENCQRMDCNGFLCVKAMEAVYAAAELRGRAEQREADARIAEDEDGHFSVWGEDRNTAVAQQTCRDIAAAIRNQGQPT